MYAISSLLETLPNIATSRLVNSGFGLWIAWQGTLNSTVPNTFKDYGGVCLAEVGSQALWFFPYSDVFRALGRLQSWAGINRISLFCQVLPLTFQAGPALEVGVTMQPEFAQQDINVGQGFEVWVHPKFQDQIKTIPGLALKPSSPIRGMAAADWMLFNADQGLDYESTLAWYFILRPMGKMTEKEHLASWRGFFAEIQQAMQRLGLKYIADEKTNSVIFPLDNMRLLRTWCGEILNLIKDAKADPEQPYWPSVSAAKPRRNLPFNEDLLRKFGLDWDKLSPDFPHLQYRDAFLLQEWFKIHDIFQGTAQETIESWCNVSLRTDDEAASQGTMDVAMSRRLTGGEFSECFYCGLKNHPASACPTRNIPRLNTDVWNKLGRINIEKFSEGFKRLDDHIDPATPAESAEGLLYGGDDLENLLVQAMFEINAPAHFRTVQLVWRARGKEWPDGFEQLAPAEGEFVWDALEILRNGNHEQAQQTLKEASLKYARSYQPHSLQGFVFTEIDDHHQAQFYWEESERLSYTSLQQGYFLYLQARSKEIDGDLKDAAMIFRRAADTSPAWSDPLYRQGVCMVKMGFPGQAMDVFNDLIDRVPHAFNRLLVDPELDRGRLHIMSALWDKWSEAKRLAREKGELVEKFTSELSQWFDDGHQYHEQASTHLERMRRLMDIENYSAFRDLIDGVERFTGEMGKQIDVEVERIEKKTEFLFQRLKDVQREASWFPFPKLLREFNRDFNYCVEKLNWINSQHLRAAETLRRTRRFLQEVEDRHEALLSRLVSLRIIRDTTLFTLILGRNFIWIALIGLGLALVAVPSFIYFAGDTKHWLVELVMRHKAEIMKGLVIILLVLALVLSSIISGLTFEKRKRELFSSDDELESRLRRGAPDKKNKTKGKGGRKSLPPGGKGGSKKK